MPQRLSLNATTSSLLSGPKPTSMLLFGIVKTLLNQKFFNGQLQRPSKKSYHHDANLSYLNQSAINKRHQFVGFISAHTSNNSLSSFCLHSFAVFHCDVNGNTIVTCLVMARHHILLNMQDHLLQLIQLNQKKIGITGSSILTNSHIGGDISLQPWSQNAYKVMGFNTDMLTQDWEVMGFIIFGIEAQNIIPLVWYSDSHSWAKYGHLILHSSFHRKGQWVLREDFATVCFHFSVPILMDYLVFN
jgi:hypothetical protein